MDTDIIIVGEGIAGLVLSFLLKQKEIDHAVLGRRGKADDFALAETLPPSAMPLLNKLGLLPVFERTALQRTHGYHSVWGRAAVADNNFFFHRPYQYGLKLDKKALTSELADAQQEHIIQFEKGFTIQQDNDGITACLDEHTVIRGKIIIDATGRKRALLNKLDIDADDYDNLTSFSCHAPGMKHPRLVHGVFVESFREGWGIASRLSEKENVVTLFTHKNSSIQALLKQYEYWHTLLAETLYLKDFITPASNIRVKGGKANSSKAQRMAGANWMAIGDAAISFDPLSSHGITNAVYTAQRASVAIEQYLSHKDTGALTGYEAALNEIFAQYLNSRRHLYLSEQRWQDGDFWKVMQQGSMLPAL